MTMESDKIILNLYKAGFYQKAMKRLMDDYGDSVYSFIMTMVKNEDDARDISQDVFIKIYKKLTLFRADSSLKTWIFSIAKNTTYSYVQRRQYDVARKDNELNPVAEQAEDSKDNSPELRYYISELSSTLKTPLTMHYFMECSYEEIAHILDIPLNTIKAQIRRAKLTLYKKLKHNKISFEGVG